MTELIGRSEAIRRINANFRVHPAVALVGPRQCGKTTLARMFAQNDSTVAMFDLEDPVDRRKLQASQQTLRRLSGLVIIDEIQRQPELLELLRVILDAPDCNKRFLILGSASPQLIRTSTETLAGRVGIVSLSGFSLQELPDTDWTDLWVRGGFPRSYLAVDGEASYLWRRNFIRTFLERDIPQLGITTPAETLRRFWTMIAHYHGQVWNSAEFARALGTSEPTARRYVDILSSAFMVRLLAPWHANVKKRQLRSPKVYLKDPGLLHALLDMDSLESIYGHPKCGASFEGFVIEQLIDALDSDSVYFWATHAGAELDLLITIAGRHYGIECKFSDAPRTTRSMRVAMDDLKLEHLWVVYPGDDTYRLDEKISATSVQGALKALKLVQEGNFDRML